MSLLLTLLASTALADGPDDHDIMSGEGLYWPVAVEAAPGEERALVFVEEVLALLEDAKTLDPAWLRNTFRPAHLPVASELWYTRLETALLNGATGAALRRSDGPVAVVDGPDYTRVVLDGTPLLSLVVRQGADGLLVDRIEATSCGDCGEAERFASDIIAAYARPDASPRLLPNIDFDLAAHFDSTGGLRSSHWLAALEARHRDAGGLRALLDGAVVDKADGAEVVLTYPDGQTDTWTVRYDRGLFRIAYDELPETSPLRMSKAEADRWRTGSVVATAAAARWRPTWQTDRWGGIQVGHGAVGAELDPLDGTVLVVAFEPDGPGATAFRVDPSLREVVQHWRLPDAGSNPMPMRNWYTHWPVSLSPDGKQLAFSLPTRLWTLDLRTGRTELQLRPQTVASLRWAPTPSGDTLLVSEDNGNVYAWADVGIKSWLPSPTLALDRREGAVWSAGARGEVTRIEATGAAAEPVTTTCCGAVAGAAFHPDGGSVLMQCQPGCSSAAVRVGLPNGDATNLAGSSGSFDATSWSPEGRWFTTHAANGAAGAVLLWPADDERPVTGVGDGPVQSVRWSADGSQLLTVEVDGDVWLYEVSDLLSATR